jgi:hypothetical protein
MHMGVDESRCDQLVACVDLVVDLALEALADEQHAVAFVDQLGIAPQRMMPAGMRDQPAAGDACAHEIPSRFRNFSSLQSLCHLRSAGCWRAA